MGDGLVTALVVWGTGLVIFIATRNPKGYDHGLSPDAQHTLGNLVGAVSLLLGFILV